MLRLIALMLMVAGSAWANDSAWGPYSGSVKPMEEHPTVRMESADIDLALFDDHASGWCAYVFHNDGPATTVKMGFPIYAGGGDSVIGAHQRVQFRSEVDSAPVDVRRVRTGTAGTEGEILWYVRDVHLLARPAANCHQPVPAATSRGNIERAGLLPVYRGEGTLVAGTHRAPQHRGPLVRERHVAGCELGVQ